MDSIDGLDDRKAKLVRELCRLGFCFCQNKFKKFGDNAEMNKSCWAYKYATTVYRFVDSPNSSYAYWKSVVDELDSRKDSAAEKGKKTRKLWKSYRSNTRIQEILGELLSISEQPALDISTSVVISDVPVEETQNNNMLLISKKVHLEETAQQSDNENAGDDRKDGNMNVDKWNEDTGENGSMPDIGCMPSNGDSRMLPSELEENYVDKTLGFLTRKFEARYKRFCPLEAPENHSVLKEKLRTKRRKQVYGNHSTQRSKQENLITPDVPSSPPKLEARQDVSVTNTPSFSQGEEKSVTIYPVAISKLTDSILQSKATREKVKPVVTIDSGDSDCCDEYLNVPGLPSGDFLCVGKAPNFSIELGDARVIYRNQWFNNMIMEFYGDLLQSEFPNSKRMYMPHNILSFRNDKFNVAELRFADWMKKRTREVVQVGTVTNFGEHYVFIMYDYSSKTVAMADTLQGLFLPDQRVRQGVALFAELMGFLFGKQEYKFEYLHVPNQEDGRSCGPAALYFLHQFLSGSSIAAVNAGVYPQYRRTIIRKSLNNEAGLNLLKNDPQVLNFLTDIE